MLGNISVNNRSLALWVIILMSHKIAAQCNPGPNSYLVFEDKTSLNKFEYLYPQMIQSQKYTGWQNTAYAKFGIQSVVTLKETDEAKDTVGLRKFNTEGFMTARDTFTWNNQHYKSWGTWLYEYSGNEKRVRQVFQSTTMEPEFYQSEKNESFHYYNDKSLLVKFIGYAGKDTSSAYFEYYPNRIMKK